jgi:hypothetical protein
VLNKWMALGKILDSHSEGSEFNPWSDLRSLLCSQILTSTKYNTVTCRVDA